jgi:23S rRNA (cytidine1920-2'-O)/16S rRNA (cytidine1409-2'-O)-methyltransferase
MTKQRLDIELTKRRLTSSRSQAESWIKLGKVTVDGVVVTKPGHFVRDDSTIRLTAREQYVSRAGLKLASVSQVLKLDFNGKVVLDVGSSTGGFTDYALKHGARKVYAVDVGTDQLHPSLRSNSAVELHEKMDIRDFVINDDFPDIVVIDVSFISLRDILPYIATKLSSPSTCIAAMVKPQFEAEKKQLGNSGVIKNDTVRRAILKEFESWAKHYFVISDKADSEVHGARGNQERFYLLMPLGNKKSLTP